MIWHYDNKLEIYEGDAKFIEIERIYCINFDDFNEEQWEELTQIYNRLPGARYQKDVPYWYGVNENRPPYLWVSVEPPGLQVVGSLPLKDWLRWDESFQKQLESSSLPIRES